MAELLLFWNLVVKFTVCYRLYEPSKRVVVSFSYVRSNLNLYLHRYQIQYGHTPTTLCYVCMYVCIFVCLHEFMFI